ncbi:MAG TPA: M23 family metallopeptidase, partial [Nevskiaceae bacterium]|nr:M23 family metallopeptidase [Nevskiaceae bacterium]
MARQRAVFPRMAFLIALVAAAGVIIWTQGVHAKRAAHHKLVAERTKTAAPSLPPAQAQAQAQPAAEAAAWKQVEIEPGQTLGAAFDKAGLDASNLAWVLAHTTDKAPLQDVHPGARFWFKVGAQGQFEGIRYYRNATTRVTLLHKGGAAQTQIADLAARRQRHAAWGIIHTTLSGSAAKKAVPIPVVARVTHLFKRNLDFRDLRSGSYFAVIYSDIKSVADPRPFDSQVLAAEVHADGHTFTAYRFEMKPGHAAYYTRGGVPLIHPTLWRYPVHYTYMSSPFGMRVDPVVHRYQLHQGIDLAAPLGTPIHAAGNGVITYQGWAHGYGKYVTIRNTPSYTTGYAHLARFAAG